jgi:hypothetical protein
MLLLSRTSSKLQPTAKQQQESLDHCLQTNNIKQLKPHNWAHNQQHSFHQGEQQRKQTYDREASRIRPATQRHNQHASAFIAAGKKLPAE